MFDFRSEESGQVIRHLKDASIAHGGFVVDDRVESVVAAYIADIKARGTSAIRDISHQLDGWSPDSFRLTDADIRSAIDEVPDQALQDIRFAQEQVRRFAQVQRESMLDVEVETLPGVVLGHRHIPVRSVGCYIPGGQYPLVASAHMGIVTAKVAGVQQVVAVTPPFQGRPNPAVVAAINQAGADAIYCIGGVQAIAALAFGVGEFPSVDMIVGPGNAYVAEAKRQVFGAVGIDLIAGPTETLILADDTVDGELCATDILGQVEHGVNSPATLITNSERLARDTLEEIERLLLKLPTAHIARLAWRDHGQVILCNTLEEMVTVSDELAAEHVQVMTAEPDYFLNRLTNYGALFLGARTNVAYGDKVIGTNHTLPTKLQDNKTVVQL